MKANDILDNYQDEAFEVYKLVRHWGETKCDFEDWLEYEVSEENLEDILELANEKVTN